MNSAEFKTIRESLCLSRKEMAERLNVHERTVGYWESETRAWVIPPQVIADLLEWDGLVNDAVSRALEAPQDGPVTLKRSNTASLSGDSLIHGHRLQNAYVQRLRRELIRRGVAVVVEYER